MVPGIDPKVDYAFKRLFGREENRALLIDLIDAVLDPPPHGRITEIQILNPFNEKEALDDKLSVVDIKARDASGRHFNVEMQILVGRLFPKRVLYYWSRLHQGQLKEGEEYVELRPTISISLVNGVLFPAVPDYHLDFRLTDGRHQVTFTDDIAVHLIELPKFARGPQELATPLDLWAYFMIHAETLDTEALPATLDVPVIRRAMEELRMLTQDDLERERYEARLKVQRDALSFIKELGLREGELDLRQKELDSREKELGRREEQLSLQTEQLGRREEQLSLQTEQLRRREEELRRREEQILARDVERDRTTAERIALIHLCQRRLSRPVTPREELAALPPEELDRLAEQLEKELLG